VTRAAAISAGVALLGLLACSGASSTRGSLAADDTGIVVLPKTHAECRAGGGEVEPLDRGGRCFAYYTPRRDTAAYSACRGGGGSHRLEGPGRSVAGQSHVCTLIFEPARPAGP
jgi:hypothetical protein